MWLAERPISFMKCQYFLAELQSRCMLPMTSEHTFGGGVEAERCFDKVVLEVAVDGFGTADHLHAGAVAL